MLSVVLFSGGRGSGGLSAQLVANPDIALTIAINGYDDGASTGEVRRFLGDCLGPSDFRKNASRLARELRTATTGLIDLLDLRLPVGCSVDDAVAAFGLIAGDGRAPSAEWQASLTRHLAGIDARARERVAARLGRFEEERRLTRRPISFSDCSVGNLVFAGSFLQAGRDFNRAVEDYCALLGLPPGIIENVTDGTNAFLTGLDLDNRILISEEDIVDAKRRNHVKDIYLLKRPLSDGDVRSLASVGLEEVARQLEERSKPIAVNPRLIERIASADLIIYAPGTQHSSLFPSYLTPGLSVAIARNLTAIKLLITNIQQDAEIADSSAVDIIERAVFYLKEKNRQPIATPCLITHYLINDPGLLEHEAPYVPLGRVETLEDPRLVRIGNYEDGISGRHDASKILAPFVESLVAKPAVQKVAVLLQDSDSINKLTQTILEMIRGGIQDVGVDLTVFYQRAQPFDENFTRSLPFATRNIGTPGRAAQAAFFDAVHAECFDYVLLFECSGMYRGEDIVSLASQLTLGRLDAAWGSRRLSVKDIHYSYRLRYRHKLVLGTASYIGSHLLSLAYLLLYGRYISDTLSGVRAVRASICSASGIDLAHKRANQHLLSALLLQRAEILEIPVLFFEISPDRVRRTTVLDGLQSLATILWWRAKGPGATKPDAATSHARERAVLP